MNALIDNYYTFGSDEVKIPSKMCRKTTSCKSIRDSVIVRFIRILGSYSVTKLINYY